MPDYYILENNRNVYNKYNLNKRKKNVWTTNETPYLQLSLPPYRHYCMLYLTDIIKHIITHYNYTNKNSLVAEMIKDCNNETWRQYLPRWYQIMAACHILFSTWWGSFCNINYIQNKHLSAAKVWKYYFYSVILRRCSFSFACAFQGEDLHLIYTLVYSLQL